MVGQLVSGSGVSSEPFIFVEDGFCRFESLHGGEKRAARESFVVQNPEMKISPWRIFVAALQ